ncbi:ribonuclease T [Stakelama sp. CBK3Z-3]|uniref:Ribonuclease T n=1 Tax=Stakelama flava TaxID=2860338 RepID=A0ABS6XJ86_9SPHN|nr:ribonuclease T [Stakelama flava]MBW4329959.1 ribonuclease T [Stakelama flava]
MKPLLIAGTLAALVVPGVASAQAYQCAVPSRIEPPHAEGPTAKEPRRVLPTGGYTLAIGWSPEQCHGGAGSIASGFQCSATNQFGFTLHGLWPDGKGAQWPQYCRSAAILPERVIRRHICATPSAQLMQHEYAKHGTCTGMAPADYFAKSTGLFGVLRYPDMVRLSHRDDLTAGQLAAAIAAANPGMTARMMRITASKDGYLREIWFCLDTGYRYRVCPAFEKTLPSNKRIRIRKAMR